MLTERHVKTVKQPKAIRYRVDTSPLQRSVQRSLLLRAVTETALKSPFLCVNRSPIRYGFRAGAKAIRLRTIVSSREFVFNCAILNHFYQPNRISVEGTLLTVIMRLYASTKNNHKKKKTFTSTHLLQ